jgi:hypothetical protein
MLPFYEQISSIIKPVSSKFMAGMKRDGQLTHSVTARD